MKIKSELGVSNLAYFWWVLEPALFICVYYLVFGIFLNTKTESFFIFLICGKIPFLWFSRTVSNSAGSIVNGAGLMNQVNIPKWFFPLVVIGQDSFKSFFVFILMLGVLVLSNIEAQVTWFALIPIAMMQLSFIGFLAFLFSALLPFFPDMRYIINTFIVVMMFVSGIFYDLKQIILPEHQQLFLLNPMANSINMYREALLYGNWPDWQSLILTTIVCTVGMIIALQIIKKFDSLYPRVVLQ